VAEGGFNPVDAIGFGLCDKQLDFVGEFCATLGTSGEFQAVLFVGDGFNDILKANAQGSERIRQAIGEGIGLDDADAGTGSLVGIIKFE